MSDTITHPQWTRILWIVPMAALLYVAGQAITAAVVGTLPLERPQMPSTLGAEQQIVWALVMALILALGVAPLARRLSGGFVARWLVLAAFLYLVHTANTAIETLIFTRMGGQVYMAVVGLPPALLGAAVLTAIRPVGTDALGLADGRSGGGLAWRLAGGWLAFPAAYFVFGILIAPLAIDAYSDQESILVLPPMRSIIGVQAIRSTLFLLPTLAVVERWTGSRPGLWLALGWAHWALVGLSGLIMPTDLISARLRLIHALEIGADSFAYIGMVVTVLAAHRRA